MVLEGSLRTFAGRNGNCLHICGWHMDYSSGTIICESRHQLRRFRSFLQTTVADCDKVAPAPSRPTSYHPINVIRIIELAGWLCKECGPSLAAGARIATAISRIMLTSGEGEVCDVRTRIL